MLEQFSFTLPTTLSKKQKRIVRIYRPDSFSADTPLAVLYMHDGQNVFGGQTATFGEGWEIDRLIEQVGYPLMVVAISSAPDWLDRYDEYSFFEDETLQKRIGPELAKTRPHLGGKGQAYATWLMEELKPWVDAHYATIPEDVGIMGSSMGGVISLYMMATYPSIRRVGALSTAVWSNQDGLIRTCQSYQGDARVYMDIGTNETSGPITPEDYLTSNAALVSTLARNVSAFRFEIEPGALHNEVAWRKRLPNALHFLYGNEKGSGFA